MTLPRQAPMMVPAVPSQDVRNATDIAASALAITWVVEMLSLRSSGSSLIAAKARGAPPTRAVGSGHRSTQARAPQRGRQGDQSDQGQGRQPEEGPGDPEDVAQTAHHGRADAATD